VETMGINQGRWQHCQTKQWSARWEMLLASTQALE